MATVQSVQKKRKEKLNNFLPWQPYQNVWVVLSPLVVWQHTLRHFSKQIFAKGMGTEHRGAQAPSEPVGGRREDHGFCKAVYVGRASCMPHGHSLQCWMAGGGLPHFRGRGKRKRKRKRKEEGSRRCSPSLHVSSPARSIAWKG